MDSLERMRVFGKVVERGSLTRAANDLGITQPTVSKALSSLEASLHAQLLLRSTRRVTVTEAGRRYYERCREVLERVDEAEAELADAAAPRGALRVHGPVVLGELFLAPITVAFQRQHPGLRCELTCLDSFVDLVAEGADVAIRLGEVTDPSLVRRRLGSMERLLVAAPSYLKAAGAPRVPADLALHATVRFSGLPWGNAVTLQTPRGLRTVELQPGFTSNNAIALRHALLGGLGIGVVTRWLVEEELRSGALTCVLPKTPPPALEVNAVFPSARFIPSKARQFVEFFVASLKGTPGVTLVSPKPERSKALARAKA